MLDVPQKWRFVLSLFACLLLSACVRTTLVRVPVKFAARVPVRVFPSIWVVGGNFDEDERIAERLAAHLAQDSKSEVRQVELSELEPARVAGKIPATTAVVLVELELREGVQQYWETSPVQSCSYYGCTTQYQSYAAAAPEVTAVATVTVYEGPTARVLQRERVGQTILGESAESARFEVVEAIASEVEQLVDTFTVRERVLLYRANLPEVESAVARIEAGKWAEGRALLEIAKGKLGGLQKTHQARIWYDLGMARRFAPGKNGLDEAAYQASLRAFSWAVRLDPREEYDRALIRLERHYRSVIELAEQARARQHNFQVVAPPPAVPAPPDATPAPVAPSSDAAAPVPAPNAAPGPATP